MLDELDHDPIFAEVRAARPDAPPALAADVIRSMAGGRPVDRARGHHRRWIAASAAVLCAAAAVVVVLGSRRSNENEPAVISERSHDQIIDAGVQRFHPDAASLPAGPTTPTATWDDLRTMRDDLLRVADHELTAAHCPYDHYPLATIRVKRTANGDTVTELDGAMPATSAACAKPALARVKAPALPSYLGAVELTLDFDKQASPDWLDPRRTIARLFGPQSAAAQLCIDHSKTVRFLVTHGREGAAIKLAPDQQLGNTAHGSSAAWCFVSVFTRSPLPQLPTFVRSMELVVPFVKN